MKSKMANILSISSQVVHGFVGNEVTRFALQRSGHDVWCLPTVLLSNHPGHKIFGGARINATKQLRPVLESLEFAGHLKNVDAVITGYLPSKEHVFFAFDVLKLVRKLNPKMVYLYDPSLGEDSRPGRPEGLYIDVKAAECQRAELLPLADIVTPNRFELEWLTMRPVMNEQSTLTAIDQLNANMALATPTPAKAGPLSNLLAGDDHPYTTTVPHKGSVPHGTGDLMAALFLGALLDGESSEQALGLATAGVEAAIAGSAGHDELQLIATQNQWSDVKPCPVTTLEYSPA